MMSGTLETSPVVVARLQALTSRSRKSRKGHEEAANNEQTSSTKISLDLLVSFIKGIRSIKLQYLDRISM